MFRDDGRTGNAFMARNTVTYLRYRWTWVNRVYRLVSINGGRQEAAALSDSRPCRSRSAYLLCLRDCLLALQLSLYVLSL